MRAKVERTEDVRFGVDDVFVRCFCSLCVFPEIRFQVSNHWREGEIGADAALGCKRPNATR